MTAKNQKPDPVKLLKAQHREVEELFEQYEKLSDGATAKKRHLFVQIADRLAAHAAIEERLFYPACRSEETEDELLESLEEHLAVKREIADLLWTHADDEHFDAKMKVLQEMVAHHVKEEESELFPQAKELIGDQSEMLALTMKELFDDLMTREPRRGVPTETTEAASIEGP